MDPLVRKFWESHKRFEYSPIQSKVVLLSVPKCGTLMVRNIFAHFVGMEQLHIPFVDSVNILEPKHPVHHDEAKFFTGHVAYTIPTAVALRSSRVLALVRDPVDFVLSQSNFLLTEERRTGGDALPLALHEHAFCQAEVVPLVIGGTSVRGGSYSGVVAEFVSKALSWVASGATLVRYEDVKRHAMAVESNESQAYFRKLLALLGRPCPDDWQERIKAGVSREISSTASEALPTRDGLVRQAALTRQQFRMLEAAAPGLRASLGYTDAPHLLDDE